MAANFPTSDPSFTKTDYGDRETPLYADYNQALLEIIAIGSWILSTSPLNILRTDNTTEFTPTADYHPATKKYVDDNAGTGDMTKAVYDTDDDGRVDKAESVDDGTNSSSAADVKDAVDKKHTQGTDTTLGTMTEDIDMGSSHQITNLAAPAASGEAIRQTTKITEALLEKTLYITINEQTGASYTLVLADDHKMIDCNYATAFTLTVPPNSSVAFSVGTQVLIRQKGAGQVTISAGSGVTINSPDSVNATVAQYSMAGLIKVATDTWALFGDLE